MANLYSVESLLVGKAYQSRTLVGEIVTAEKHPKGLWFGKGTEAYLVVVRTPHSYKDHYRTLAVKVGE